jgi:mercuric ion binding protein
MKRIITAVIAGALLTTPLWAASKTATLKVPGMVCAACPITVRKALQRVQGVSKIDVNFPQKEVIVTFDDAKTNDAALTKATADVGFPSQVVKSAK